MAPPDPTVETLLTLGQLAEATIKGGLTGAGDRLRLLRLVEELWPRYRRDESVDYAVLLGLTARKMLSEPDERRRALLGNVAEFLFRQHALELAALHCGSR